MSMRQQCILVLIASCVASVSAFAESPPPRSPFGAITWTATKREKPSAGMTMGQFQVKFEETTLDEVRGTTSVGRIAHQGDAGESIYWLCYTDVGANYVDHIWIIAHGEMGGSERRVTSVSAMRVTGGSASSDCPALPKAMSPVMLGTGIWLGESSIDIDKKLGAPSHKKGSWQSYDYSGRSHSKCEGDDVMNWLVLHIEGGRMNQLHAGQVTAC